jgi:hypothetical protein
LAKLSDPPSVETPKYQSLFRGCAGGVPSAAGGTRLIRQKLPPPISKGPAGCSDAMTFRNLPGYGALGCLKLTRPTISSTATEFFHKLSSYDLTKIPVVHEELNPVFEGCYTTHSDIKQLNRRAEATTTSAEAVATVASCSRKAACKRG